MILATCVFIIPYIILMYGYIVQTENQQEEIYIKSKLETLKKTDYLYSSLSNESVNKVVFHELLISSLNGYADIIVLDESKQHVLFTNNNHIVTKPKYFRALDESPYKAYEIEYLKVKRVLMYSYDEEAKRYYIIIEPAKNAFDDIKQNSQNMLMVIALSIVLLLVIIYIYSNKISSTLYTLTDIVKNYRSQNILPQSEIRSNTKFYDELYKIENEIYETINYLIERENEQTKAFYKSKLENLQNQINPHFLYNTLENINQLAMMNDIEDISKLSRGLANLFRYNTEDRNPITTVNKELYIISEYIKIMKIRFPSIEYHVHIQDDDLVETEMLKFTLQPIVENIFKHQSIRDHFEINIDIHAWDTHRIIEIYTNQSIDMEIDLSKVNHSINHEREDGSGIGLYNVNKRIQLHYGDDYGIYLKMRENRILVSTVVLPL
ncbi:hypothetical protein FJQ64_07920 [Lysinibacillus sp. BW-2-10]|nr:hypothetical protein FJQ64_07920 [Lysinibacillus sp. BW-2-10]